MKSVKTNDGLLGGKPSALAFLHIFCLSTLAVAHPLYTTLGQEAHIPFFIAHQSQKIDLVLFTFLLSFVLPALTCLLLWLVNRTSRTLGDSLFTVILFFFLNLIFLPINFGALPNPQWTSPMLSISLAAVITVLYRKSSWLGTFLSIMSLGVIISPLLFFNSPASKTVLANSSPTESFFFASNKRHPDIVMIVFDELPLVSLLDRNRQIDKHSFPNFHLLASTSTWFRNATSIHISTGEAARAILSGERKDSLQSTERRHSPPHNDSAGQLSGQNIFSLLAPDYEIRAIELVTKMAPEEEGPSKLIPPLPQRFFELAEDTTIFYLHLLAPDPLRAWLPQIEGQWQGFLEEPDKPIDEADWPYRDSFKRLSIIRKFVDSLEKRDSPTLYYLHSLLPHYPFVYGPTGQFHENQFRFLTMHFREVTGTNNWPDETGARLVYQAHLMQLEFVDRLLGKVLDRLAEQDMFDASLIVLVSDHGTSYFWDSEGLGPAQIAETQAAGSLYVPLFLKLPGQKKGQVSDVPLETTDLLPVLMEFLNSESSYSITENPVLTRIPDHRQRHARLPENFEFEHLQSGLDRALQFKLKLDNEWRPDKAISTTDELLGRHVDKFDQHFVDTAIEIELDNLQEFRNFKPNQTSIPAYLSGKLTFLPPQLTYSNLNLGITVNGTICSVTKTSELAINKLQPQGRSPDWLPDSQNIKLGAASKAITEQYFLVYLSPNCFTPGRNSVAVYGLTKHPGNTDWQLIEFTSDAF